MKKKVFPHFVGRLGKCHCKMNNSILKTVSMLNGQQIKHDNVYAWIFNKNIT